MKTVKNLKTSSYPNIWDYKDYRTYLNDFVHCLKNENKKYSYRYFARALGTTPAYLKLVTSRKRNISLDKLIKISNLLKLSIFECQYFIFLFLENCSTDKSVKTYFRAILNGFDSPTGTPDPVVENESRKKYQAARNWLMLAISGLAACDHFKYSADWIHQQLGGDTVATKEQIRDALNGLDELGVLKKIGTDKWQFNIKSQTRSGNPFDFDYMQIHQTGLRRCLLALELLGKTTVHDPKHFYMNIIAVNEEDQKKVLALFENFKKNLWDITHASTKPDRVMLISNSAISLNGAIL